MTIRLHVTGLPHTQTITAGMTTCAFTQKVVRFGEMMAPFDYEVVVYSGEHNDTVCSEHVPVVMDAEQRRWWGDSDPNTLPLLIEWNATEPYWRTMNARTVLAMQERVRAGDLLLLTGGTPQKPIADAFPEATALEWTVGYDGTFAGFCCYESHAWKHVQWARAGLADGRWYDEVIPNYFRPDDFALAESRDDYLLFVGRLVPRKGLGVALDVAKATGRRLVLAGSGAESFSPGYLRTTQGQELRGDIEYVGTVGVEERSELMARAHALLAPTLYIEPFGGVAVEAQLCGTPSITTDWGAFTETVQEGVTGFRFRTLQEGAEAVERAGALDPATIRARALERYSLEAVGPQFDRWFRRLDDLNRDGWYTRRP